MISLDHELFMSEYYTLTLTCKPSRLQIYLQANQESLGLKIPQWNVPLVGTSCFRNDWTAGQPNRL